MAEYEGFVASKKTNGLVEILISPTSKGVPGASENINRQICHCAADGPQVSIDAINEVGAAVGDWVLVRRDSSPLIRNALVLVGIPMVGLIAGIITSYFMTACFTALSLMGIFVGGAFVIGGLTIGVLTFRRIYQPAVPVIVRVLKKTSELATATSQECTVASKPDFCEACKMTSRT